MKTKKSLAETHPDIAKEWHPTKNGDLTPQDVSRGSSKKIWWKCDKGDDHVWLSNVDNRTKGNGCSVCNGKTVVKSNCLSTTHPEVAKEWHPTKNGDLTPEDVTGGSGKKVWWKCDKGYDHEWQTNVNKRTSSGRGCPICAGQKIVLSNCLATTHPEIAKEWHPTKNGKLSPFEIGYGSGKKVWWKCNKGDDHIWNASIDSRKRGRRCPICSGRKIVMSNCLATTHPEIAKKWHPTKNGDLTPYDVGYASHKKVWWKCDKGDDHIWFSYIFNVSTEKTICPVCSNRKIVLSNCLTTTHPEIAKEWHPTKNGNLTPNNFTAGSHKKVWWKCDKGDDHEWYTGIRERKRNGCPVCSGNKTVLSNCLATTHPHLASQWHPTKNGKLSPYDITYGSRRNIWWKCDKGDDHEWQIKVSARINNSCPICSNQKVVLSNCLATTHPEVAKEWHPTKNGDLTPEDVTAGSGKKVWWKCDKVDNHEWLSNVSSVVRDKSNCPYCTLTPQSRQELTITFELIKLFKKIDPKGLKARLGGKIRSIDIFIPELKLCIEFDGAYWHKGKRELDKIKSELIIEDGFNLIRVRQEPLKKIYDTDIISKKPFNGKKVTDDILSAILSLFELDTNLVSKIKAYQSKDVLQNEKGLEKYIEGILTEKASKGK